jgi:hypothetical protein
MTKRIFVGALVVLFFSQSSAFAAVKCTAHPKDEWMPQETLKKKIEAEGTKIKNFKVSGDCYEMYGLNRNGNKVETYYDTKTGEIIKSMVR